jgi:hypothetical protein
MKTNKTQFLTVLAMLITAGLTAHAQFSYTTNNGTITITGYTGPGGVVTIPNTITGLLVTEIGAGALNGTALTSVTIPANVTNIGQGAFQNCPSLLAINVDPGNPSYTGLNGVLFNASQSLLIQFPNAVSGGYTIPDSVTVVGSEAFEGCWRLTNLTLSVGLADIESNAFEYCSGLTSVTLSDEVTNIGAGAFQDTALASVTIPDSVTHIGSGAFQYCPLTAINVALGNPAYSSVAGVLFNQSQTTLLEYPDGLGGSYAIPASVLTIGATAFEYCSVTNVTLSLGLVDIESNAFTGCPLTSIVIPNSVTNIGDEAFYDCFNLTNITMGSNVASIGNYAFSGVEQVTSDGEQPGYIDVGCPLISVTIPNSVTSIGANAFYSCVNLTNVTLGNGVTSIGVSAFAGTRLTSITIPNSVTSIGANAFYNCVNLTNVTLGNGVTSIGVSAFAGTPLTAINVGPGNPAYSSLAGVLFNQSQTMLIEFPPRYSAAAYSIPASVTDIETNAFLGSGLTSVAIPNSVTNIGAGAFQGCYALTAINVAPGNPAYSSLAGVLFNQSQSTLLEYPGGLGGSYAIPTSVLMIGAAAFENCSVTNVTLSLGLVDIGSNAFAGCPLTSITVPASITSIGVSAFSDCGRLSSAYFLGNAPDADATVFSWDGGLPQVSRTAYYLPGTTGWAEFTTNTGVWTALWTLPYPLILNGSFGVLNNQFGFIISWATNVPVVVEASTNLSNPVWTPIATNTLTGGTSYFSDPQWTNYPARFYHLRSQ